MAFAHPIAIVVRFVHPWWLVALAAATVPVLLAARARRRGRRVGRFSVALQCIAVCAAVGALSAPEAMLGRTADAPWIILRDVSPSTRGQSDGDGPWDPKLPREQFHFADAILAAGAEPGADETNASPALRLAAGRAPNAAGVVIETDGRFHDADWPAPAAALGRTGVDVIIVPMDSPPPDARIAELRARRAAGGRCELRVTVRAEAVQRRTVTVRRGGPAGAELWRRTLDLLAGDAATFRLTDPAIPAGRSAVYHATISPGDQFPENDRAAVLVPPATRTVAVVAGEGVELPADLPGLLGVRTEALAASGAPVAAAGWMNYAAVLLADSTGALLGAAQRGALAEYVRGGGGLVLIGAGPHGRPADREDPLNRVAALVANPYERTPLKVIVALDASGSMTQRSDAGAGGTGRVKFDVAAGAVMALKSHLTPRDALAVITFSDKPTRIYDSGGRRPDFVRLRDALAAVRPGGPTNAGAALAEAARHPAPEGLRGAVLLVSDLISKRFDAAETAAAFRRRKLSLAIVEIQTAGDAPGATVDLERLAAMLDAPHVRRETLAGLAEIFARFVRDARGEPIRRGNFPVTVRRRLFGLGAAKPPRLDAYVLSGRRRGAEVIAAVGADAILARRTVGLGRSVSAAVPLETPHNPQWRTSPAWRGVLAAATRWVLAPEGDPRFDGGLATRKGTILLTIEARDARGPMNLLKLTALSAGAEADGNAVATVLVQTAPGRYEARVGSADDGLVSVAVRDAGGRTVWRGSHGGTVPREFAALGADWQSLRRLAALTGGRMVAARDLPAAGRKARSRRYSPLWQFFLAAALAIMLLEWALTRVWRTKA